MPAAPQANDHTLLHLHLLDPVAATVAVDAVVRTLRDLGLEAAVLDSLATVLLQILREARAREVFAGDPPTLRVALSRHGRQLLGLVRLIYRVSGYSYRKPEFYSPVRLRRLRRAVTRRGGADCGSALRPHAAATRNAAFPAAPGGSGFSTDPRPW